MLKPKSIITRLRIVSFQCFLTKMTEISWGFFSRRQKVKIHLYLMSFDDFKNFFDIQKLHFFKGQTSEKVLASQQRLAPPLGGGGHMVPYGTMRYHKVPYGTIRYLMVP